MLELDPLNRKLMHVDLLLATNLGYAVIVAVLLRALRRTVMTSNSHQGSNSTRLD
jgi:hypothetical protein